MGNNHRQLILDKFDSIFKTAEEILSEWTGSGNLQFPIFMGMIAIKMNWDTKQIRRSDPILRFYIKEHPDWNLTKGAHGGIQRMTDKQKKDAIVVAKNDVKNQLKVFIEAKAAKKFEDNKSVSPIQVLLNGDTNSTELDSDLLNGYDNDDFDCDNLDGDLPDLT